MGHKVKKCSLCKEVKSTSDYHKDKSVSGGLKSACKDCSNVKRKLKYYSDSYDKKYRENNRESARKYAATYRKENKEKVSIAVSEWSKNNRDKRLATALKYKYNKMKATPTWELELTEFVTLEAAKLSKEREKIFGFKWHIDHIIPLQGKEVCGLHVWNNLQVIPAKVNASKGNKYDNASCEYR